MLTFAYNYDIILSSFLIQLHELLNERDPDHTQSNYNHSFAARAPWCLVMLLLGLSRWRRLFLPIFAHLVRKSLRTRDWVVPNE